MATKRKFGLNPIALGLNNSTLYEPQRQNHFEAYIYLPPSITNGDSAKATELSKYITLACKGFSLPNISTEAQSINYGNTKINLAGNVQFSGADTLNCTDFIGADIEGILYSWQNIIYNPETSQMGWAVNYKTKAQVVEYSGDGACVASWILDGVFPKGINYGSLSKDNGSLKEVSVSLAYDIAYRKYADSNRNEHAVAASKALANMVWKPQDAYSDADNGGGPLNHIQDNL